MSNNNSKQNIIKINTVNFTVLILENTVSTVCEYSNGMFKCNISLLQSEEKEKKNFTIELILNGIYSPDILIHLQNNTLLTWKTATSKEKSITLNCKMDCTYKDSWKRFTDAVTDEIKLHHTNWLITKDQHGKVSFII